MEFALELLCLVHNACERLAECLDTAVGSVASPAPPTSVWCSCQRMFEAWAWEGLAPGAEARSGARREGDRPAGESAAVPQEWSTSMADAGRADLILASRLRLILGFRWIGGRGNLSVRGGGSDLEAGGG